PDKPVKDLTYNQLKKYLQEMLSPHRSVVVSQHYFLSTYQKEDQTIPEFVAALQSNVTECNFNVICECNKVVSVANLFLRAQFIRGLKDSWIKEQLLQANVTEFPEILSKAIALEASRLETQALSKQQLATGYDTASDINKVSSQNRSRREQHQNRTRVRSKTPNYRYRSYSRPKLKSRIDFNALGIAGLCLRCGKNNHNIGNKQDCKIIDIYDSPAEQVSTIDLQKYFVTVLLNGKPAVFEVDSGAGFTLLPEDKFQKLNLD
ncbi:uncharacterized protein LOC112462281, partial [Temnothorax curvispinosus]|uniref:Uncharacterized protein LOC112462281 n=1 Tax=Temnothorax curvispinosus TaxID=300111 RepID=A0A6J1QP63_9HYME